MEKKLKTPSDYPQFYFRLNASEKTKIDKLIAKLVKRAEKNRSDGELQTRRNHIITKALIVGLQSMVNDES